MMSESLMLAGDCALLKENDVLEIDLERFENLYGQAVQGNLSFEDEDEVVEIASLAMTSPDLDENSRELFQSAFMILTKKNKKFMDLRGFRRSQRNESNKLISILR